MSLEKVSIFKGTTKKPELTDDDFPTLGSKPVKKTTLQRAESVPLNFAAKSREWAEKQKEDERIAAEAEEKERNRIQMERMIKEKEQEDEKRYKKTIIAIASKKKMDEFDLGNHKYEPYDEEEPYESPLEEEEDEEDEEEEYSSHWDGRRYHDEY